MTETTVTLQSLWVLMILLMISYKTTSTLAPTTPTPSIEIQYKCDIDGEITINTTNLQPSAHSFTSYMISSSQASPGKLTSKDLEGDCSAQRASLASLALATITLTNCTYDSPVHVYLIEEKNLQVIGGKNFREFDISCHQAAEGKIVYVGTDLTLSGTEPTPKLKTQNLPISTSLSMSITPSTAFVGESLKLTISDTQGTYYILPVICSASDGTKNSSNNITILTNGNTLDESLVTDFTVSTKGQAITTMYAFEFLGADTVHISCTVRVCPDINCGGQFTSYTTPIPPTTTAAPATTTPSPAPPSPQSGRRRRRAADNNHSNHVTTVQTTFRVLKQQDQNNKKTTNGSNKISTCLVCYITTVILLLTGYLRHQS